MAKSNFKAKAAKATKTIQKTAQTVNKYAGKVAKVAGHVAAIAKEINHPEWYTHYAGNVDLVNLNYGVNKTRPISVDATGELTWGLPGHTTFEATPVIPGTVSDRGEALPCDAWVTMATQMFTSIRAANTSLASYKAGDLGRYIHIVRLAYAAEAMLHKYYRMGLLYSIMDARVPDSFFLNHGLNPGSIKSNLAQLRMFGIQLSNRIHSLLPLKIALLDRTRWFYSNVFIDSNDVKGAMMDFNMWQRFRRSNNPDANLWVSYVLPKDDNNIQYFKFPMLDLDSPLSEYTTAEQLMEVIDNWMDRVASDPTISQIATEIKKAFGGNFRLDIPNWDAGAMEATYDESVLTQIQNATVGLAASTWYSSDYGYIPQLTFSAYIGITEEWVKTIYRKGVVNTPILINTYKDSMNQAETLSYTRLTVRPKVVEMAGTKKLCATDWGTEVITNALTYWNSVIPSDNSERAYIAAEFLDTFGVKYSSNAAVHLIEQNIIWSQLDYAPKCQTLVSAGGVSGWMTPLWDFNNYAVVPSTDEYTMQSLQYIAVSSLLWTPEIVPQAKWLA